MFEIILLAIAYLVIGIIVAAIFGKLFPVKDAEDIGPILLGLLFWPISLPIFLLLILGIGIYHGVSRLIDKIMHTGIKSLADKTEDYIFLTIAEDIKFLCDGQNDGVISRSGQKYFHYEFEDDVKTYKGAMRRIIVADNQDLKPTIYCVTEYGKCVELAMFENEDFVKIYNIVTEAVNHKKDWFILERKRKKDKFEPLYLNFDFDFTNYVTRTED